jgi:hypothetical protein
MTNHRHSVACCGDCGAHPAGTCYGCDKRRRNEARREAQARRAKQRAEKLAVNIKIARDAAVAASGGY